MTQSSGTGQAPPSPTYADIKHAIRVLDGVPVRRVRELMNAIFELGRAPQVPDWSDPDRWIGERLSGELRQLAQKIWDGSDRTLNPRYLYGHTIFVNRLKLLEPVGGIYRLGERGRLFLAGDDSILRELVALRSAKRRPSRPDTSSAD
jgi:restriction system protein